MRRMASGAPLPGLPFFGMLLGGTFRHIRRAPICQPRAIASERRVIKGTRFETDVAVRRGTLPIDRGPANRPLAIEIEPTLAERKDASLLGHARLATKHLRVAYGQHRHDRRGFAIAGFVQI